LSGADLVVFGKISVKNNRYRFFFVAAAEFFFRLRRRRGTGLPAGVFCDKKKKYILIKYIKVGQN